MQIDFSANFDRVNHSLWVNQQGIEVLEVLCCLSQFLSNRSQHVMVDGSRSKLVNVVPGVPQGCVLGPLLFLL